LNVYALQQKRRKQEQNHSRNPIKKGQCLLNRTRAS